MGYNLKDYVGFMSGIKPTGMHRDKRLTAATIRNLSKPGLHADGNGLYLKVDKSGAKRWIQRIVVNRRRRDIGLGGIGTVSLAEAREAVLENKKQVRAGDDPIAAKRLSKAILSFKDAAQQVHDLNKPTWRNEKHGQQWMNTMDTYVFPFFGSKQVSNVDSADVMTALTPIWNSHPETARRVKQRIGTVMKYAMAKGWRKDNPADAITQGLPKHDRSKVKHRNALAYERVADAIALVQASEASPPSKLAFEFLVLTATRSGEVRGATWAEVDLDKRDWTIPASRMKTKKQHRVPLPDRCITILEQAKALKQADSDLIFPGTKAGKPLSDMTLSKLMKELKIDAVPHGFRSSFRDWAGEQTSHPREVIEFALAHVIKDKAEAAYARSDLYLKRRQLMEDWASFLVLGV